VGQTVTPDPTKQKIEVKLPTFEGGRNPRQTFTMPRGARIAETHTMWVNCETLPSIPKPVRKYESSEDLDKSEDSDISSRSSSQANPVTGLIYPGAGLPSTRPKAKPPVPKRSYSTVEKYFTPKKE
jgi:hypothetical protein